MDSKEVESATAGSQIQFAIYLLHPKLLQFVNSKLSVKKKQKVNREEKADFVTSLNIISGRALHSIIIVPLYLFNHLIAIIFAYFNRENNSYNRFINP